MTKHDDGGPAFPQQHTDTRGFTVWSDGMTLLDWFAGQAVGAYCAHVEQEATIGDTANWAYRIAAAMLAEKRRREQQEQDDDEA